MQIPYSTRGWKRASYLWVIGNGIGRDWRLGAVLWIFTEVSQLIYSTVTISIVLTFFCFLKIKSLEFI